MSPVGHPRINLLLYKISDTVFDARHKVDTSGVIDLPEMEGRGRHYVGTPPRAWKLMMKHLPIDPSRFTYLDFGCGKGRTLLLAADMGFKKAIGVDISSQLLRIADRNMAITGAVGETVCCDVREFDFPLDPLVLFMYNPFSPDVMQPVAENLKESVRRHPREVYVVYYSAPFRNVWPHSGFKVFRETEYTYPNYVIYHASSFEPASGA
ncbi:MAG: class I SAM-dependent methyltransferase [Terracidiphilus sp.]